MPTNRMFIWTPKKSSSFVLTSLKGSTYGKEYASPLRSVAALLEGLFEHPAGSAESDRDL
jgi:hypothetical protein